MKGMKELLIMLGLALILQSTARAEGYSPMPGDSARQNAASPHDFRLSWGDDSAALGGLNPKEFESPALRSGARTYYDATDHIRAYAGAGFERDPGYLDRAGAYAYSRDLPGNGASFGVGELGITVKPVPDSGFSLDLNTKGYTGTREGVAGNLQFKFEF